LWEFTSERQGGGKRFDPKRGLEKADIEFFTAMKKAQAAVVKGDVAKAHRVLEDYAASAEKFKEGRVSGSLKKRRFLPRIHKVNRRDFRLAYPESHARLKKIDRLIMQLAERDYDE